jgi:hypothetical protein
MGVNLSLEELERFDSHPSTRGKNHRYCCPLCGHDKPIDKNHQTLSLDSVSGAWHCFRCHASGLLTEHHTKKADKNRPPHRMKGSITPKTAVKTTVTPVKTPVDPEELAKFDQLLTQCVSIKGTPAESYLLGRGITFIPDELCYHPNPLVIGPSVGFPLAGKDKVHAGFMFRAIEKKEFRIRKNPRYQASGQVFVTLDALNAPRIAIVEAPIDALSLATCGIPAIATIGTSFPDWLTKEIGPNKVIYFGYDNDDAGEKGVKAVDPKKLGEAGIKEASRIRPPKGCKDWNDALQQFGANALALALSGHFPLEAPHTSPNRGNELEATEDVTPPAKRNVGAKIREYTEDMGVITLEYSEDVIIAGKVRKNLTWLRPDLIGIYENEDRIEAQRRELRTHARETQKQP